MGERGAKEKWGRANRLIPSPTEKDVRLCWVWRYFSVTGDIWRTQPPSGAPTAIWHPLAPVFFFFFLLLRTRVFSPVHGNVLLLLTTHFMRVYSVCVCVCVCVCVWLQDLYSTLLAIAMTVQYVLRFLPEQTRNEKLWGESDECNSSHPCSALCFAANISLPADKHERFRPVPWFSLLSTTDAFLQVCEKNACTAKTV